MQSKNILMAKIVNFSGSVFTAERVVLKFHGSPLRVFVCHIAYT